MQKQAIKETWWCGNCCTSIELDIHGRCGNCGSDAVDPMERRGFRMNPTPTRITRTTVLSSMHGSERLAPSSATGRPTYLGDRTSASTLELPAKPLK